jgi:antitoxin ChpS
VELLIEKWDTSAAVRLPTTLLSQLGVALGDKLSVDMRPEGLVLRAGRKTFSLADLMAQCDLEAPPPADVAGWERTKPNITT